MKAVRIHKTGGPEVMQIEAIDLPPPGPDEVRVRHTCIGVNFIDTYYRSGLYPVPSLPSGLGHEAAGVIEALGDNVRTLKIGQRVAYCMILGAYAEANIVPAGRIVPLPDNVADDVAAAALLKGMTAQYLLKRTYRVKPGDTILVHAAAGGVGLLLCQWAKQLGARVIGIVGSDDKVELARAHGCEHVLHARRDDIAARVRDLTGGTGVPVVYDSTGRDTFASSLDSLAVRGVLVSFGSSSGPVDAFNLGLLASKGSLFVTRPTLAHYTRDGEELMSTAADLFTAISSGIVTIRIGQRLPLDAVREAHEALHARTTTGATILTP